MHCKYSWYICIQWTWVLCSVVITWQSNPPISQFNSPCNEFTSFWWMFVYNTCTQLQPKQSHVYNSLSYSGSMFTKLFRIRIKIRLKLNNLLLWTFFETYYNYLTIDCWYLIKYVLQSFFMKEKVNLRVATAMKNWAH